MIPDKTIILLGIDCDTTRAVFHFLSQHMHIQRVLLEEPVSKKKLLKGRVKKLGWIEVIGQLAFMGLVAPVQKRLSAGRYRQILRDHQLSVAPIPEAKIKRVTSVNSESCRNLISQLEPDVVLVNGTRIISARTLAAAPGKFVNVHTGITPLFRGVHGGYWAIASGKPELFGTTIHRVDTGIDTGGVISQVVIRPEPCDTFATYPMLQYAAILPELLRVLNQFLLTGTFQESAPIAGTSKLWYHPTIWSYLKKPKRLKS